MALGETRALNLFFGIHNSGVTSRLPIFIIKHLLEVEWKPFSPFTFWRPLDFDGFPSDSFFSKAAVLLNAAVSYFLITVKSVFGRLRWNRPKKVATEMGFLPGRSYLNLGVCSHTQTHTPALSSSAFLPCVLPFSCLHDNSAPLYQRGTVALCGCLELYATVTQRLHRLRDAGQISPPRYDDDDDDEVNW